MVAGVLTRKGKVVYRSHRSKRDRVKHIFRLTDARRVVVKVYAGLDATYFLSDSQFIKNYEELEKLFEIFELTSDMLNLVYINASPVLKLSMNARVISSSILRFFGIRREDAS